ncbi:MAG: hypothetical protein HKM94_10520, partial [Halobacteria archaeon]|nr:hypothetical protein [Halobacteria archaeon]
MMQVQKMLSAITLLLVSVVMLTACGWDPNKPDEQLNEVQETIANFKKKDPGIKTFFNNAY